MKFNIKKQARNKYFWISIVSLIVLTSQTFNIQILPQGFEEYANSVLAILVTMGVLNNNNTKGLGE